MQRRSKAQWQALLTEQQRSGLSAAQFCRINKLSPQSFSTHKVRLQNLRKADAAFMPVVVNRPAPALSTLASPAPGGVRLLAGSCALQFDTLPEAQWLVSVVRGLA